MKQRVGLMYKCPFCGKTFEKPRILIFRDRILGTNRFHEIKIEHCPYCLSPSLVGGFPKVPEGD